MIKLNKVVLINWMYFQKSTLNINGNTALVGINGSGKSTLIDAIQMLLLGNQKSKFNANANAEKRTLESYVRGAVSLENDPYLRKGDVVTYIALEISLNREKHVFGININYRSKLSKLDDPKYFYVKGMDLTEDIFIKDNYPKNYDVLVKELKSKYDFIPFQTLYSYHLKIKDILGLKDEKAYFKALSRAVGLKNITDCNKFFNEFVLDEKFIDVSSTKKNYDEINKLSNALQIEKNKQNALDKICDKKIELDNADKKIKYNSIEICVSNIKMQNDKMHELHQNEEKFKENLTVYNNKKHFLGNQKKLLNSNLLNLKSSLQNNFPDALNLQTNLNSIKETYDYFYKKYNAFVHECEIKASNFGHLSKYKNNIFDSFYKFLKEKKFTTESVKKQFLDFRKALNKVKNEFVDHKYDLNYKIKSLKENLLDVEYNINRLENNKSPYNKKINEMINAIRVGLKSKFNKNIEVKFLCEYLDISNAVWRNAIEGYLGNQRFYIVVPNQYYKEALKILQQNMDFYQTRIIDGQKLQDQQVQKNSLGEFIRAKNSIALNYSRYILNRVSCANSIETLNDYDVAITPDCILYKNYSVGRINPKLYQEQYIGSVGRKNTLSYQLEQKSSLESKKSQLLELYSEKNTDIQYIENELKFIREIIEDNAYFESIDKVPELSTNIKEIQKQIKFYSNKPQYIEISTKIADVEKKIETNEIEIDQIDEKINNEKILNIDNDNNIKICKKKIDEYRLSIKNENQSIADDLREKMININVTDSYIKNLELDNRKLQDLISRGKAQIEQLMLNVRDEFSINIEPKYENINKIIIIRENINTSIFDYQSKVVDLQQSIKRSFFNDFITKLNKSIYEANETIKNLNHSLEEFKFGNDSYKIKMEITKNVDLRKIYDYAKEYNSDDSKRGLFIDFENENIERAKIIDLISKYIYSENKFDREKLVDYRQYLYFDVEIKTPNGVKKLNDVIRTQSGGEVQVPFYILAGVAFQQTLDYKRKGVDNVMGIVLYDEAFDKMDAQRIQSMLQFYRDKLNLQVILAVPDKIYSLASSVKTFIAVIRDGKNTFVRDISHEVR